MELIAGDAGIAGTVQMAHKPVHQFKECDLMWIDVFTVEPIDHIASEKFVLCNNRFIPRSGSMKKIFGKMGQ